MDASMIPELIREKGKSEYWQAIYNQCKEAGVKLFVNNNNFTHLQVLFMNYLNFYNSLNMDIALGDVDKLVLKSHIYEDAYMYYKQTERTKERTKKPAQQPMRNNKGKEEKQGASSSWVFKKRER